MEHITTPAEHLGFQPGDDRKLAGWPEIVSYLDLLGSQSDRIDVREVGRSTEDNPFVLCTISSPENLSRCGQIKSVQQSLADPRTLVDGDAARLIGEARAVVAITCSIHATEVGATQMSVELAHLLASSHDPRVVNILDNVVLLLVPSMNPDGLVRVKGWYDASIGTHFEGSIPPYLYHKYAGHDNNRDWFMFTQQETRLVVEHVHNAWRPHITYDLHQTRSDGMRMILPPLVDPIGPNVDPVLQSELSVLGTYMAAQLTAEGKAGVAVNVVYDSYSPSRSYPHYHGGVRVLSEAASVKIGSPIEVQKARLRDDRGEKPKTRSWNHPLPWAGGRWALRDVVEYDLSASMACLEHAARNREWWIRNSHDVLRRASTHTGNPFGYVIPKEQHDKSAAAELEDLLQFAEVELHESQDSLTTGEVRIEPGDTVVLNRQPFGSFAQTMLEVGDYPDSRQYPGGPPKHPYDATVHCLPLKMGVACQEIKQPVKLTLAAKPRVPERTQTLSSDAPAYAVRPESNGSARTINRLMAEGSPVFRSPCELPDEEDVLPPGTWVVPDSKANRSILAQSSVGLDVLPLWRRPDEGLKLMRPPKIGLYSSYVPCIEEGWTRFLFDDYEFRYFSLVDRDVREGGLSGRFDCIIVPHQSIRHIHRGFSSTTHSPRFSGGLGDLGVERLKEFAERGGTLIGWDDSARFLVRHLELPVRNALSSLSPSHFFAPGSLLKIEVDTCNPIGFGMPRSAAALFTNGPAYRAEKSTEVARFSEEDTLLGGWLIGRDKIAGLSALVTIPVGLGRVVLFGFRPHFRAQARGTYKLLFNSVYHSPN